MTLIDTDKRFKYIFIGCLVVAGIIIFLTFFNKKSDLKYLELAIDAKDETIKVLQEQRPIYEKQINKLYEFIDEHEKKDSLIILQISANKQTIKQVDDKIKNIPNRIAAISNDNNELRRAISDE